MLEYKPNEDLKRPILVLGWFFLIFSTIPLLTAVQANDIGDLPMWWATFPTGLAWAMIGALFIVLDHVFGDPYLKGE